MSVLAQQTFLLKGLADPPRTTRPIFEHDSDPHALATNQLDVWNSMARNLSMNSLPSTAARSTSFSSSRTLKASRATAAPSGLPP